MSEMENDNDMRRIMELLLPIFLTHIPVKKSALDLCFSSGHHITDFFQNMKIVLSVKKILIYKRWEHFCEMNCFRAVSSHEMYLRYVLFACDIEVRFYNDIFEKLLSAFALVMHFNNETLINSGLDFCELSVDIFMAFYKTLKESFHMQGGFQQFAEYLRHHEYLPWGKYLQDNPQDSFHKTERQSFLKQLFYKFEKETENVPYNPNLIRHSEVMENTICESLAREVLLTTKIQLPTLTNAADLEVRLQAAREMKERVRATFLKPQMSCEASKCEMATSSKHEMLAKTSVIERTDTNLKCETSNANLELVSMSDDIEPDSMSNDTEPDSMSDDTEPDSMSDDTELESMSDDTELEWMSDDFEPESINEDLRPGAMGTSSKFETTTSPNYKTMTIPFKSEIGESISIRNASEEAVSSVRVEKVSNQKASETKTKETVMQNYNWESDSQRDSTVPQKTENEWYENIVQKVVKYNNLKCSDPEEDGNIKIYKEADKSLNLLNAAIKSLIDVLKNLDEE